MRMPKCWSASSSPTRQREGGAFACACAGSTTANRSRCGHICGRTAARSPRRGATCCRRDSRRMNGFADGGPPVQPDSPDPRGHWHATGVRRRLFLLALLLAQTYVATYFMAVVLPYHGRQPLEIGILVLFAILFAWVTGGFWTAVAGF